MPARPAPLARRTFRRSWGVAFGLTTAAIAIGSRHYLPDERWSYASMIVACGLGFGGGAFLTVARRGAEFGAQRWAAALVWGALGVLAMAVNLYLAAHPFEPSFYSDTTLSSVEGQPMAVRRQTVVRSPALVHLSYTLPIVGALGGLSTGVLLTGGLSIPWLRRLMYVVGTALLWALAFVIGGRLALLGYYFLAHGVSDIFESLHLSATPGIVTGAFLGGFLGGWVTGWIGSWAPTPSATK